MSTIKFSVSFKLDDDTDDVVIFNLFKRRVGDFCSDFGVEVNSFESVDQAFVCSECGEVKGKEEYFWRVRKDTGAVNRVGCKCRVCSVRLNSIARRNRKMMKKPIESV